MFDEFFYDLDDFLLDSVFQPLCNLFRRAFGWSKNVPEATSLLVAIAGLFPVPVLNLSSGKPVLIVLSAVSLLWILSMAWKIYRLITETDDTTNQGPSETIDNSRLTRFWDRRWSIVLTILSLPPVITTLTIPDAWYIGLAYLAGLVGNFCAAYFNACVDLPPGRSFFAKVRERLMIRLTKLAPAR